MCDPSFDSALGPGELVSSQRVATDETTGAAAIAVSASGDVFVVGTRYAALPDKSSSTQDGWFIHLSATGALQGELIHDLDDDVAFHDVALTPDGSTIVAGSEGGPWDSVIVAHAVAQDGTLLWRQELDLGSDNWSGNSGKVAVSAQGRIVVGATRKDSDGGYEAAFVELAATGEPLRMLAVPPDAPRFQRLVDLEFNRAGLLYAGTADVNPNYGGQENEWIGRWDVDGTYIGAWERPTRGEDLVGVSAREDGVTALIWARVGPEKTARPVLRRLDEGGNERWAVVIEAEVGDHYNDNSLLARQLTTDCLGRSWVFAEQPAGRGFNYDEWLIVYDDDGVEVGRHHINPGEDPPGYGAGQPKITVDPFGNLVTARNEFDSVSTGVLVQTFAR